VVTSSNTAFVWGTSHWGSVDATWETPHQIQVSAVSTSFTGNAQVSNVAVSLGPTQTTPPPGSGQRLFYLSGSVSFTGDVFFGTSEYAYVQVDDSDIYASPTTNRVYMRLPAMYRNYDRDIVAAAAIAGTTFDHPGTFDNAGTFDASVDSSGLSQQAADLAAGTRPLLRYLQTILDQAGDIEALLNRFSYDDTVTPPKLSALTDPTQADAEWLPWLGQFVGLRLPAVISASQAPNVRTQIATALSGAPRGSKAAIAAGVTQVFGPTWLAASLNPVITPSMVTDHYGGNQWQIGVLTPATANLNVTNLASVKPAGFTLIAHTS
jgi:hypothetical protein